jgi:hypothetical protein
MLRRLCFEILDWFDHAWTAAWLTVLDWLAVGGDDLRP